jgi:ribonuclease J
MLQRVPTKKDFWFLALGGSGEIGMNLNLYGHDHSWLMVDLGVTFNDRFGVDIITPDPTFIIEQKDKLAGLVLTHAHEDHLGAVPYLWPYLKCPIYATPFAAAILRNKLYECPWRDEVQLIVVPLSGKAKIGPFEIEYINITHSIPEPNAVCITTPLGTVLHTGDWKIDPDPLVGQKTNIERLKEIGQKGVTAMVCDSTNVFTQGTSGSELAVRNELIDLIKNYQEGRIAVALFASNIARLDSVVRAAVAVGRKVSLFGLSLERMVRAAHECGYIRDMPELIDHETAKNLPKNEVLLITTGSQGEPRAALTRIANQQHPVIDLDAGDTVIFSSRVIPGNERSIAAMQNRLIERGIRIITASEKDIHVSGHPGREELEEMYKWIQPTTLIPVHGEVRHMHEQARFGLQCGVKNSIVQKNGSLIAIHQDGASIIEMVQAGRWAYDGTRMIPIEGIILRDRQRLSINGTLSITIVVNKSGSLMGQPKFSNHGICETKDEVTSLYQLLQKGIRKIISGNGNKNLNKCEKDIYTFASREIRGLFNKKPLISIHLMQI